MIIQIRGTSGSGKSTLVRNLLDLGARTKYHEPGRKQPVGYLVAGPKTNFAVPGHYESACGGCDTLPGQDKTFAMVRTALRYAPTVIFEGLLASEEVNRTVQLHSDFPGELTVLHLTTPVEECLVSIRARREARGDDRPLKEDNTRNRVKVIQRACDRLEQAGVEVHSVSREGAANYLRGMLA